MGNGHSSSQSLQQSLETFLFEESSNELYKFLLLETQQPDSLIGYYYSAGLQTANTSYASFYSPPANEIEQCDFLRKEIASLSCDGNALPLEKQLKLLSTSSDLSSRIELIQRHARAVEEKKEKEKDDKGQDEQEKEKVSKVAQKIKFPDASKFWLDENFGIGTEESLMQALNVETSDSLLPFLRHYGFTADVSEEVLEPEEGEEGGEKADACAEAEKALERLSVRQLKDYLSSHAVDTSDCIEKVDLVNALKKSVSPGEEVDEDPCVLLKNEPDDRHLKPIFEKLGEVNPLFVELLRSHPVLKDFEKQDKEEHEKAVEKRRENAEKREEEAAKKLAESLEKK